MSIQSNINNTIYIGGLMAQKSLEGYAQTRRQAKALQANAEAAQISLDDIEENFRAIERGEKKPFSETELKDIDRKIEKNVSTIYDAVTAADNPQLSKYINKEKFAPESYKKQSPILKEMGYPVESPREFRSMQLKNIEGLKERTVPIENEERVIPRVLAANSLELAQDNKRRYSPRFNKPELKENMPDVTKTNKFSPDLDTSEWGNIVKRIDQQKIDKWKGKLNVLPEVRADEYK